MGRVLEVVIACSLHLEPSQYSKMVNLKATISFSVVGRVRANCQNFARGGMRSTKLQKLCSHTLRVACYYEYDLPSKNNQPPTFKECT